MAFLSALTNPGALKDAAGSRVYEIVLNSAL